MLWKQRKKWYSYDKGLMATEYESAALLKQWLSEVSSKNLYGEFFEVIDLQKYHIYREERKVRQAMNERMGVPFVFVAGKN